MVGLTRIFPIRMEDSQIQPEPHGIDSLDFTEVFRAPDNGFHCKVQT